MSQERPKLTLGETSAKEIERAMLDTVLKIAGDDENKIREGIITALRKETEPARRTYLWNTLQTKARRKIRAHKETAAAA